MCLNKIHRLPKISRKPIQVYKLFKHHCDWLVTPYKGHFCKVGETIKAKHSWLNCIFKDEIRGEGVHAFRNIFMAKAFAGSYCHHYLIFCHVYLCEIPPFTPYWIGDSDDIAASKMIIKEKVEV